MTRGDLRVWLFVGAWLRVSLSPSWSFFLQKRVSRGDKVERADSQTDGARGHPMRSCLPRLPSPPCLPPSLAYPHEDSDGLCFTGGWMGRPAPEVGLFSKIEKGSERAVALGAQKNIWFSETYRCRNLRKKKKRKILIRLGGPHVGCKHCNPPRASPNGSVAPLKFSGRTY